LRIRYSSPIQYCDYSKQRKHAEALPEYEDWKKSKEADLKISRKIAKAERKTTPAATSSITGFITVTPRVKPVTKGDKLLLNFVIGGMHPLSIVEEPAFKDLLLGECDLIFLLH
jgi:hypothetical protein